MPSYLRLVPSRWAGAYQCWGRENREAALRFVTGSVGESDRSANAEVKCFDLSANPYLVAGAVLAAGLSTVDKDLRLPDEVSGDPAAAADELAGRGVARLPQSVPEALGHLEQSGALRGAMGEPLYESFVDVRRAEVALFAGASPEAVVAATRWRY